MPNIASVLKAEITRIARKEAKSEIGALKKAASLYRSEIAALKRRMHTLEQQLRRLSKVRAKTSRDDNGDDFSSAGKLRFSAKGLSAQRRRLGLSAHDCSLLLGTSQQTIYNWEQGKARPLAQHLPAIAALRTMGRKEAKVRLESMR